MITCPIPRTACSYNEDGSLSADCESDGRSARVMIPTVHEKSTPITVIVFFFPSRAAYPSGTSLHGCVGERRTNGAMIHPLATFTIMKISARAKGFSSVRLFEDNEDKRAHILTWSPNKYTTDLNPSPSVTTALHENACTLNVN